MIDRVLAERAGGRLSVTLDRPAQLNALDSAMMWGLVRALTAADPAVDPDVRMVAISGNGKAFCVGADIKEFQRGPAELQEQGRALQALTAALDACPVPTVAAVHGHTLGAGAIVAALCDVVVACDDLAFGAPEIRFGMYPGMVHAAFVERMSNAMAWQLCASGRIVDATEARSIGLVTDIVPAGDARAVADRLDFYERNAAALAFGRAARRACAAGDLRRRVATMADLMHENYADDRARADTAAFAAGLGAGRKGA